MIFLTGGTGLLGSHVLVELTKNGCKVRALKRTSSSLKSVKNIFKFYLHKEADKCYNLIDWVDGDINDVTTLLPIMKGCDSVYHCAGYVSFYRGDFKILMKINKEGTANIVNTCLALGVSNFCHVSSTAAIGRNGLSSDYTEKNKWVTSKDNSNYAVSKYSAEMEVWRAKEEGLNVVIVNPSVILGAGNWQDGSLTLFSSVQKGLMFYTEGVNAFVDARDVANCMIYLMENKIFGERFLAVSENVSFKALFFNIADELNVKRPTIKVRPWMTGVAWRLESIRSVFGAKPKVTKETTRSAMTVCNYSNQKIVDTIGYQFISIKEAVKNAVEFNNFK